MFISRFTPHLLHLLVEHLVRKMKNTTWETELEGSVESDITGTGQQKVLGLCLTVPLSRGARVLLGQTESSGITLIRMCTGWGGGHPCPSFLPKGESCFKSLR